MSTVVKDLGAVSAYAYAVEKGYTGTEAEFAELMADYAEVGQRAEDAAGSALESKTAAQTASTTATNKASEATTAATTATTKAGEASTSASTATSAKDTAVSASQTATSKASEATTAAASANTAKTDAVAAKTAAETAQTAAETAQGAAEEAAESVSASAAQIATNTSDISELKSGLTVVTNEDLFFNPVNHIVNSAVTFSNKYNTAATQHGIYIPVTPNDHIVMKRGNTTGYYALLKDRNGYLTNGASANLCDSFSTIKSIGANGIDLIVPTDATFLWVYVNDSTTNYMPSSVIINGYNCLVGLRNNLDKVIQESGTAYRIALDNNATVTDCFIHILRNGVNASDVSDNGYWSRDDGNTLLPNNGYAACNSFARVEGGKSYYGFYNAQPYSYWSVTWYDADKKFISGAMSANTFTAPANAAFARLSWSKANIDATKLVFTEYTQAQVSAYMGDLYVFGYDYRMTSNVKQAYSNLFGKKLCVIGDSICYGVGYSGGYAGIIANENSMEVQNLGISGATLCTGVTGHQSIYSTIASLDNDGDYYIFEGGFNDYNQHVPLFAEGGSFVERIPQSPNGITSNIYDCMENLCYHLNVTFKGKKVGFVFPHKISYTDWEKNNLNLAYKDYKDLQKKVLAKYAIPYIDLSEVSGMNTRYADVANAYTHNGDYVHPNQLGYETYYAPKISAWMNMM